MTRDILSELKELEKHLIFLSVEIEAIGSDEYVFVYRINHLPKEHWEAKRRMQHFKEKNSLQISGGASYMGGYDSYEEAWEQGFTAANKIKIKHEQH
jgi:hypothetical protein